MCSAITMNSCHYDMITMTWRQLSIRSTNQVVYLLAMSHDQLTFIGVLSQLVQKGSCTVMFLSFRTDRSGQTVQTQIRQLLIRVYTVCSSSCIFWMHYSKEKPSCSTFRVIATKNPENVFDCNTDVYMYFLCLKCTKTMLHRLTSRKHGRWEWWCHKTAAIRVRQFRPVICRIKDDSVPLAI